jgi:transcriptional regulator with XRE-family HTH domain
MTRRYNNFDPNHPNALGEKLLALRLSRGLSIYKLAQYCGVYQQSISDIERGICRPSWDLMIRIARVLEVDINTFDVDPCLI